MAIAAGYRKAAVVSSEQALRLQGHRCWRTTQWRTSIWYRIQWFTCSAEKKAVNCLYPSDVT